MKAEKKAAPPLVTPKSPANWRAWLVKHHTQTASIRLRLFKKDSGKQVLTYAQALDEALCFGWIDGRKDPHDAISWVQSFSPRRARSAWSKINTGHAERLIKDGKMKPAGLAQIEAAKADGRWDAAYSAPGVATIPADFLEALAQNKRARSFFETLNKANLYSITYRLQTAKKPETRAARMKTILQMMKDGKKFH
jgi:uncharacterized protein YdeI (YjbR/CyaY-like superfamily)